MSRRKNNRGSYPAHPTSPVISDQHLKCGGLTVREYMATHLMAGLLSDPEGLKYDLVADRAVGLTDALLAALEAGA